MAPANSNIQASNFYRLRSASDFGLAVSESDASLANDIDRMTDGRSLASAWGTRRMHWVKGTAEFVGLVESDFPHQINGEPIYSGRAKEKLSDTLLSHGEFLPVETRSGMYYQFNAFKSIAGLLDVSASKLRWGEGAATGLLLRIVVPVFRKGRPTPPMFRLSEYPRGQIYVTEKMKAQILGSMGPMPTKELVFEPVAMS